MEDRAFLTYTTVNPGPLVAYADMVHDFGTGRATLVVHHLDGRASVDVYPSTRAAKQFYGRTYNKGTKWQLADITVRKAV
jgi:hypothetical protein